MTATRGAFERRVEARIQRTLIQAVVLGFMARRAVILAPDWLQRAARRAGRRA